MQDTGYMMHAEVDVVSDDPWADFYTGGGHR